MIEDTGFIVTIVNNCEISRWYIFYKMKKICILINNIFVMGYLLHYFFIILSMYYCETGDYSQTKLNLWVHNCLLTITEPIKRRGVLVMSVRYIGNTVIISTSRPCYTYGTCTTLLPLLERNLNVWINVINLACNWEKIHTYKSSLIV